MLTRDLFAAANLIIIIFSGSKRSSSLREHWQLRGGCELAPGANVAMSWTPDNVR